MPREIVTKLVADPTAFNKGTASAVTAAGNMEGALKKSAVAGAVAGAAMSVVSKGIDFVTDSLSGASEAAKEDTLSQDRLRLAYENTGKAQSVSVDAIEEAISAYQRKGVSDAEQRAGISDFLDLTGDATQALALNTATVELAAAKGMAYAEAEAIIRSAAAGKTAALQKAGVAIEKGASITDIGTAVNLKFAGSLDVMAETQSGKAAIANEKLGEAMESIGRLINDLAVVVVPALTGAFAEVATFLTSNVGPAIAFVQENMEIFGPALAAAGIVIASILVPAFIAWAASAGAAAIATLAAAAPFIAVGLAIAGVVAILAKLGVIDWLIARFNEIAKVVGPKVAEIINWLSRDILPPLGRGIQAVGKVAGVVFAAIAEVIKVQLAIAGTIIGAAVTVIGTIGTAINTVKTTVETAIRNIIGFFTGIGGKIHNATRGMWNGIWDAFRGVINAVIRGWNSLKFTMPRIDMGPLGVIGGFTIGTPNIPYLHAGGMVPGVPGSDVLAMLQAGERVTPAGRGGVTEVHIHIDQGAYIDGPSIDRLTNLIAQRLNYATGL